PPHADQLRPVVTGWFAEFDALADPARPGGVGYGDGPARFAGSTYDPTSHYRAARVFRFFEERGLTPALLVDSYRHQVRVLAEAFDRLDLPTKITRDRETPLEGLGGFLALTTDRAAAIASQLALRGVLTDTRGPRLRLGPAPYLSDAQLLDAMGILGEVAG
ncbi:MAG: kynureninase, partial [Chloroflexota bacterium]|nr:kynureninase [Chloroflexota bacterium]